MPKPWSGPPWIHYHYNSTFFFTCDVPSHHIPLLVMSPHITSLSKYPLIPCCSSLVSSLSRIRHHHIHHTISTYFFIIFIILLQPLFQRWPISPQKFEFGAQFTFYKMYLFDMLQFYLIMIQVIGNIHQKITCLILLNG